MLYIHQSSCISHLPTFNEVDVKTLLPSADNQVAAIEPKYTSIPPGQLRRMGRALRMGVGTGMKLLEKSSANGILIATANGGIEDSITFLNQIIDYQEGRLTPTNFVQSTFNAIAGLLGMITKNTGYNSTHVHRGLAFENALLDAVMLLKENPEHQYVVGGVDEISVRNYKLEAMAGWYKKEPLSNTELYASNTAGTLPGEGAAMFLVNNNREGASAKLTALQMLSTTDAALVEKSFISFLKDNNVNGNATDSLYISGESGDSRFVHYYNNCEKLIGSLPVLRYKHAFGEFQTVSALALWLADYFLRTQHVPGHFIKSGEMPVAFSRVVLYNNYQGAQHSFMIVEKR